MKISVTIGTTPEDRRTFAFEQPFHIGRADECAVCIKNEHVSRHHVEIACANGQWTWRDLNSSNGVFVDGQRMEQGAIEQPVAIRLGVYGPFVALELEQVAAPPPKPVIPTEPTVERYVERYFAKPDPGETVGEHTRMVRRAFAQVQEKQKRKYGGIVAALAVLVVGAGAYAWYLHQQVGKQKALAQDLFYSMKALDLDIANVEKLVTASGNQQGMDQVRKYQSRRKEMSQSYDKFLTTLKVYDPKMTEQQRLLLRVARIFGECELEMPPDFVTEVESYIKKWQSSGRYRMAIETARDKGYTFRIAEEMLAQDLPPQFFYMAMQESNFDALISGPMTRKGIAKGMWQFIPETAVKYGLKIGPLADLRRPDPGDERHHWDLETKAATRYLKDLYSTDAQASGLLVMACYNWGEDYVLPLVRKMPANPRERNFWKLLGTYKDKIPKETYDYVYYIVSAAVIGENPRLFGFDFDNPLGHLEAK